MKLEQAIKILSYHNKWRRDNENKYEEINTTIIEEAIDVVVVHYTKKMKLERAAKILRAHNEWRRDNESVIPQPMISSKELGESIDVILKHLDNEK